MDSAKAAEVLRRQPNWERSVGGKPSQLGEAGDLGAQALEAWAWVAERQALVSRQHGRWLCAVGLGLYAEGPTPLAAVLNAMEKEKG